VRLLVLGGPRFLGRGIADAALARGHEVTFFNRGTTNPELYPDIERIVGDRGGDLTELRDRSWDAVIDTSGYLPSAVRASAAALVDCGLYCFVSSISVYADLSTTNDEDGPLAELGDLPDDGVTDESYGPLKALCEAAVRDAFGTRSLVVRPGLIAGPHDPTGRFTYWPHRIARGGEVLAPAPPERLTQLIDVRDLGEWMVTLCERDASGTFNATHPGLAWSRLVDACKAVSGADAEITWVPDAFLLEHEVGEWMELPLWIADPTMAGAVEANVERAVGAGLTFRPLEETARGALDDADTTDAAGLARERETELLAEWHGRG
jgi:2'-hydroxyisoflavone reductase